MKMWKELSIIALVILLSAVFIVNVPAAGPPLKENACGACHKDYSPLMPKSHPDMGKGEPCLSCHAPDPSRKEASKFSEEVHKIHKNGKAKLECSACHAL